jgi:hypothetical protein
VRLRFATSFCPTKPCRQSRSELFDGGQSRECLREAVLPQAVHPGGSCCRLDRLVRRPREREPSDLVVDEHQLVDPDLAAIAAVAMVAAAGAEEERPIGAVDLELARLVRLHFEALAAMDTEPPDQALREDRSDRRRRDVWLDPHVFETRQRSGRIGCVQGREDERSRERRLERHCRGLQVAHLADGDHVRVAAQDRTEPRLERHVRVRVHLDLVDAVEPVLDRIFHGDDIELWTRDVAQCGMDRG